jgi:hypothetical protein
MQPTTIPSQSISQQNTWGWSVGRRRRGRGGGEKENEDDDRLIYGVL